MFAFFDKREWLFDISYIHGILGNERAFVCRPQGSNQFFEINRKPARALENDMNTVQKLSSEAQFNFLTLENDLVDAGKKVEAALKRINSDTSELQIRRTKRQFTEYDAKMKAYVAALKTLASVHYDGLL